MYFQIRGWTVKLPDWSSNPGHDLSDGEREILNDTWSSIKDKKIMEDIEKEVKRIQEKAYDKAMKGL